MHIVGSKSECSDLKVESIALVDQFLHIEIFKRKINLLHGRWNTYLHSHASSTIQKHLMHLKKSKY